MPLTTTLKTLLWISGLGGLAVGLPIMLTPVPFYASTGIALGESISMLSELRAIGAVFISCSVLVLAGIFVSRVTFFSMLLAAVIYLSCAFGRVVALLLDGVPSNSLIVVMSLEWLLGLLCVWALVTSLRSGSARVKGALA